MLFAVIIITACEKDDFCVQNPVTSKLIVSFYNANNRETLKRAEELYVWAEGQKDSIFKNASKDSIIIPLNSNTNQTIYNFSKGNVVNQFTIDYTTQEEYVSRSCGYKIIFNNLNFSADTKTWIVDFTPSTVTNIDNQTEAHVQIFH